MLSEIVDRYVKCNSDLTQHQLSNVRSNLYALLVSVDKKISILESAILYKNIPYDFNWREYLDLNSDINLVVKDEYVAKENYDLYGFYENRIYKKVQLRDINTFIYCGGKCGGVTLRNTFHKKNIRCIHSHSNEEFIKNYISCGTIHEVINQNSGWHKNIYIIDSYRLPIERKMSSFFQNMTIDVPDYGSKTTQELTTYFNQQYIHNVDPTQNNEDYHPLDEMMEYLGVESPLTFDFKKMYGILKYKNINFIKIRFQNIDKWTTILSGIVGKPLTLNSANLSKNKPYRDKYEKFKREYKVPVDYLEKLKIDKAFMNYNTPHEQSEYIKYWTSRSE
jgi:hypothetical protein